MWRCRCYVSRCSRPIPARKHCEAGASDKSTKLDVMKSQTEKDDMEAVQCDERTVKNEKLVKRLQIREEEYLKEQRKLDKTLNEAKQQVSNFEDSLRKVREEYVAQQKQANHASGEWKDSLDRYEQLLGVKIGVQDGRVQFNFVGIGLEFGSLPFTIEFKVDKETGAAREVYCNPPVPKMTELLHLYYQRNLPIPVVMCLARRLFKQHFGDIKPS